MSRNFVLVCLDTVRKDYFDKYASQIREQSSISIGQCRSVSSWTVPSHASMLTGKLPSQHGVHTYNYDFSSIDLSNTFLSEFSGHNTLGVSANEFVSENFGFDEYFDSFISVDTINRFPDGIDVRSLDQTSKTALLKDFLEKTISHESSIKCIGNAILAQLNKSTRALPIPQIMDSGANIVSRMAKSLIDRNEEPFFLFLNYMDAHGPLYPVRQYDKSLYNAPNTWISSDTIDIWTINQSTDLEEYQEPLRFYRGLYAAAIHYLDSQIAELFRQIDDQTQNEITMIITADHGENLAYDSDCGLFGHVGSLSESLLHVPLEVINPPPTFSLKTDGYMSHLQLGTIIKNMLNGTPCQLDPEKLFAERIGIGATGTEFEEEEFEYWDRGIRCVYDGPTKYIWDTFDEKYQHDLKLSSTTSVDTIPDRILNKFETDLSTYKMENTTQDGNTEISDESHQRLKELGYI